MKKRNVFYFWLLMDVFFIIRFLWLNIRDGRVPIFDDVQSFLQLSSQHGLEAWGMFTCSLLLVLSMPYSAFLYFKNDGFSFKVALLQTPFRLMFTMPSLSFLPLMFLTFDINSPLAFFIVMFLFEGVKIFTLYRYRNN